MDPVLKKILVGVLGDNGSIEECLVSTWLMSIPDVVSLSLGELDALSLSASQRYLLKAFKGYVWWHHIYQGGPPCFASMTKQEFDSFVCSHRWDPNCLFRVYIEEPEVPKEPQPQETPLTDFERSAL